MAVHLLLHTGEWDPITKDNMVTVRRSRPRTVVVIRWEEEKEDIKTLG